MAGKENIDLNKIPQHIAIIMDGNGRWARQRGNERIFGHQNAVTAVRETVEGAAELGVKYLTLYAFSQENWKRPKSEVDALMNLLVNAIDQELENLMKNNIKVKVIGDFYSLPLEVQNKLNLLIKTTTNNTGLTVILALSYSSQWEIVQAVKLILKDFKNGKITENDIDKELFSKYLQTADIPDPELLIRTSGELRVSNFLLWQIAYTEFYFTKTLWPDFRKEHLYEAILDYQKRERRFGMITEVNTI